jgi:hypothetical protein
MSVPEKTAFILIIDNEKSISEELRQGLSRSEFEVITATEIIE